MIKAILLDAGGVLFLNNKGVGYVNPPLIKFIEENQDKYIFGIISTTEYDLNDILKKDKIDRLFKLVLTSGETGLDKTDERIYKMAIDILKLDPEEIIFIDNQQDYINPARMLGINTILYLEDFELFRKEIEKYL